MPEGHTLYRLAREQSTLFAGRPVHVTSPQGRFAAGAAELDGRELLAASAVGKHLLLGFEGDRTLHVHLGLYGAWDFAGEVSADPTFTAAGALTGRPDGRATTVESLAGLRPGSCRPRTAHSRRG